MEHAKSNDTSSTSTQQPGEGREAAGDSVESLDEPLADEHVHTPEQRNQQWTSGPSRGDDDPLRIEGTTAPPLDMPSALEDKMEEVMANPHSDAQDTTDTQGDPEEKLGGQPLSGDSAQDPGSTMGGSSH